MKRQKKTQTELMNEFYQWTLDQAKKEGVGQDVIYFRHIREQTSKIKNLCGICGHDLGFFGGSCMVCIQKDDEHQKELAEIRKTFKR